MKTLLVMRHAKSDWTVPGQSDFERTLNDRGLRDLPRMSCVLRAWGEPEHILSSSAARARDTAERIVADAEAIRFDDRLYLADPQTLTSVVQQTDGGVESVLVVAHNPGLEDWIGELCGCRLRLPTAALACLQLDLRRWGELCSGNGQLQWFIIPRLLKKIVESG